MNDYALGVITPFAALAGLAIAIGLGWALAGLGRKAWASVHNRMIQVVEVKVRPAIYLSTDDRERAARDEEQRQLRARIRKANTVRNALVHAPGRVVMLRGLGRTVLISREYRDAGTR